jgi:hypothetical protein
MMNITAKAPRYASGGASRLVLDATNTEQGRLRVAVPFCVLRPVVHIAAVGIVARVFTGTPPIAVVAGIVETAT